MARRSVITGWFAHAVLPRYTWGSASTEFRYCLSQALEHPLLGCIEKKFVLAVLKVARSATDKHLPSLPPCPLLFLLLFTRTLFLPGRPPWPSVALWRGGRFFLNLRRPKGGFPVLFLLAGFFRQCMPTGRAWIQRFSSRPLCEVEELVSE